VKPAKQPQLGESTKKSSFFAFLLQTDEKQAVSAGPSDWVRCVKITGAANVANDADVVAQAASVGSDPSNIRHGL
jgi:hypothetical protein